MATMANFFHKYGHNMATFSMNFDPIFSFYCIFMWQFSKKFQIGESNLQKNVWKNFKTKDGLLIAFLSNDNLENFKCFQKVFF